MGHADLAASLTLLGEALIELGKTKEAEPFLREALEIRQQALAKGHGSPAGVESVLGGCLTAQGHYAEAEPLLLGSYKVLKTAPRVPAKRKEQAMERIIRLYEAWNKPDQASAWRAQRAPARGQK